MSSPNPQPPFWALDPADLLAALGSAPEGLSAKEAVVRFQRVGPNSVEEDARLGALRLLLRQFESPLVLILVFAAVVSLVAGAYVDASIVLVIVLGSALLSFWQEARASAAVEDLKKRLALTCRVLRDGSEQSVPVTEVVPGDIVRLAAGALVPADGIVLTALDFLVSEASVTGETFPVEKRPGRAAADAALPARTNAVFLGSSVRSGTADVLVAETGRRTVFGGIAARLRSRPPETDFARGVRRFGELLVRVMIVIVVFVLAVNLALERPLLDSLLFAVALAVGLSPELLPAIVSVTLSAGARALSRQGVIVRRLDAIENLGSVDVLCTDKTGTLTEGRIRLGAALDTDGTPLPEVLRLAFLNAALETGIANPLDAALVAAGGDAGLSAAGVVKRDEIPYDFARRRLTLVVEAGGEPAGQGDPLMITKGAFDEVLAICTRIGPEGASRALGEGDRAALRRLYQEKGEEGFRVLALALRRVPSQSDYDRADETGMTFAGLLVFEDPPKADAASVIASIGALGIATKVISGDNRFVTGHLARTVGLDPTRMLTGEALAGLSDEALLHLAPRTDLFVEIDPQQKERIVRALQKTGHAVAYMGDGINDAPALHAADVGISVEGAVDVARDSADIVLLSPDLGVLRDGIVGGRRTFANTLKYIEITVSANFGNMVSMALAAPVLPFLPLSAKQILLNNFLSDLPSLAVSTDNVDPEALERPQRWDIAAIRRFMVVFGLVSSVFDLLTFGLLLAVFDTPEPVFQTAWFLVSLLTELLVVLVLRTRGPALASRPSRLLLASTLAVAVLAIVLPALTPVATLFGFVPIDLGLLSALIALLAGYILATEFAKRRVFGRRRPGAAGAR